MAETDRESGMKGIVKSIEAAETRPLRQIVLRPEEPPEHNIYPGDDGGADYHAGAFLDGLLVGVASIYWNRCLAATCPTPGGSGEWSY